ncbi:MAG: hypothetical protein JWR01_2631 [Subtercola sp.]|nr:hypothetical protein [Subtercola sp.]
MHGISLPERASSRPPASRGLAKRLAIFGAAAALAVVPSLALAPAAFAAGEFSVTSPAAGDTDVAQAGPGLTGFAGTNLDAGDTVQVYYTAADGTKNTTAIFGGVQADDEGNWSAIANFGGLKPGQTEVEVTVKELKDDEAGTVVKTLPAYSFTFKDAPVPGDPFAVTSPEQLSTVDTANPVFEGTGTPGATVEIQYTGRAGNQDSAGKTIVKADKTWSITTDFSDLEPGGGTVETDGIRVLTYQTDADGNELPGADRQAIVFYFATAPVPLIPLSLTLDPTSTTVSDTALTGIAFTATGFSPAESLTLLIKDPTGTVVVLPGADTAAQIFAEATDGSAKGAIILAANAPVGDYTVALTGDRSARVATGTFTVVADPTPTPTPTPTTPAPSPAPSNGGGSGSGSGSGSSGTGSLANTGLDASGIGALAGGFLLVGAGVVFAFRRKANA